MSVKSSQISLENEPYWLYISLEFDLTGTRKSMSTSQDSGTVSGSHAVSPHPLAGEGILHDFQGMLFDPPRRRAGEDCYALGSVLLALSISQSLGRLVHHQCPFEPGSLAESRTIVRAPEQCMLLPGRIIAAC